MKDDSNLKVIQVSFLSFFYNIHDDLLVVKNKLNVESENKNRYLRELQDDIKNIKDDIRINRLSKMNNFKRFRIKKKKERITMYLKRLKEIKVELFKEKTKVDDFNLKLNRIELNIEHNQRLKEYFRENMLQKFHSK